MRELALAIVMILALCSGAAAQQPAPSSELVTETSSQQSVDPLSSLVEVMKDEKLRNQLIGQIEELRRTSPAGTAASPASQAQPQPATPATSGETPADDGEDTAQGAGLVAALVESVRELGGRLPTAALGAPVDVKIVQAQAQIERRLAAPEAGSQLQSFSIKSIASWALITAVALFTLLVIRRGSGRGSKEELASHPWRGRPDCAHSSVCCHWSSA